MGYHRVLTESHGDLTRSHLDRIGSHQGLTVLPGHTWVSPESHLYITGISPSLTWISPGITVISQDLTGVSLGSHRVAGYHPGYLTKSHRALTGLSPGSHMSHGSHNVTGLHLCIT